MAKGATVVPLLTFLILGCFSLSCYLISTVNPEKLPKVEKQQVDEETEPKNVENSFMHYFRRDHRNGVTRNENNDIFIPFYRYTLMNSSAEDASQYENMTSSTLNTTETITDNNKNITENIPKKEKTLIKRRSIRNGIETESAGVVNLMIINEIGYPTVEIKLKINKFINDGKEKFNMQVSNSKGSEIVDLDYNTDIRILPSNTILIQSARTTDVDANKKNKTFDDKDCLNNTKEYKNNGENKTGIKRKNKVEFQRNINKHLKVANDKESFEGINVHHNNSGLMGTTGKNTHPIDSVNKDKSLTTNKTEVDKSTTHFFYNTINQFKL